MIHRNITNLTADDYLYFIKTVQNRHTTIL